MSSRYRCDVYLRVPGLNAGARDRLWQELHRADRRLGVAVGGLEDFILLTREPDERSAREYAEQVLFAAGERAGLSRDQITGAVIDQIVSRVDDRTGRPRRVPTPSGRFRAIEVGERGRLYAMHGGSLGDWVVYTSRDPRTAVAARGLLEAIDELFELPHGRKPAWVYAAIEQLAGRQTALGVRYPCPCCEFLTLSEPPPGTFAICPVCWWEDDTQQFRDPSLAGGANRPSLREARATFRRLGVSEPRFRADARPPLPEERPSAS